MCTYWSRENSAYKLCRHYFHVIVQSMPLYACADTAHFVTLKWSNCGFSIRGGIKQDFSISGGIKQDFSIRGEIKQDMYTSALEVESSKTSALVVHGIY